LVLSRDTVLATSSISSFAWCTRKTGGLIERKKKLTAKEKEKQKEKIVNEV
tara:strand:+ start:145 stop:297 length:153 start_codon:yes stop_codon:yes gene_type:complete